MITLTKMPKLHKNVYETLDDVLNDVYDDLLSLPFDVKPSRGITSEIRGASFELTNPLARLSRSEVKSKAFSAIGELLWYLSGSNKLEFIEHYISQYKDEEEEGIIHGGYGPRLFNMREKYNQVNNVLSLLKENPNTRRAVIQLYDAADIAEKHKEIPCTCTMQFMIRNGKLQLYVSMRSNDAYKGLPHDVFAFTMFQEIMARTLKVELGSYYHSAGSLHLYSSNKKKVKEYLNEGFQPTNLNMPPMPEGDPWPSIQTLLEFEQHIRNTPEQGFEDLKMDQYWLDLAGLINIYALKRKRNNNHIKKILPRINPIYKVFVKKD
jgi:thymidylate synthase